MATPRHAHPDRPGPEVTSRDAAAVLVECRSPDELAAALAARDETSQARLVAELSARHPDWMFLTVVRTAYLSVAADLAGNDTTPRAALVRLAEALAAASPWAHTADARLGGWLATAQRRLVTHPNADADVLGHLPACWVVELAPQHVGGDTCAAQHADLVHLVAALASDPSLTLASARSLATLALAQPEPR